MGIESNKEAVAMMKNALGSIENRFREAYNKGYKDGIKEGINQAMQKIADSILEEVEAEPQTDCDGCQHYADKHTADACYECKRSYTDGYVPQTVERAKAEAVAMLIKSKDESQTDCP